MGPAASVERRSPSTFTFTNIFPARTDSLVQEKSTENKNFPENTAKAVEASAQKLHSMEKPFAKTTIDVLIYASDFDKEEDLLDDIATFVNDTFPAPDKVTDKHKVSKLLKSIYYFKQEKIKLTLHRIWDACELEMRGHANIKMPKNTNLEARIREIILTPTHAASEPGREDLPIVKTISFTYRVV